jgi:hypothetical protein
VTGIAARLDAWVRPIAPPERLAALRVLVGAFGAVYCTVRAPSMASVAGLHATSFAPIGVTRILSAPLPGFVVWALVVLAVVLAWTFVLGFRHKLLGPLFGVVLLWVTTYRNSFGMIFHTENLWVLHAIVLAFVPSADAYSLDARRRPLPDAAARYGWPVVALGLATSITYTLAFVAKMRTAGLDWVTSDALRNYVAYDNLRKILLGDTHAPLGAALVSHPALFKPLAVMTLALELGAPLALLGRRPATLIAVGIWSFHVGVLATMAILFPYPLLGIAFAPWFEVEKPARRVAAFIERRLARGPTPPPATASPPDGDGGGDADGADQNESPPLPSR